MLGSDLSDTSPSHFKSGGLPTALLLPSDGLRDRAAVLLRLAPRYSEVQHPHPLGSGGNGESPPDLLNHNLISTDSLVPSGSAAPDSLPHESPQCRA